MGTNSSQLACEVSLFIARPPEAIWNFMLDLSNDKQWRTGVIDARLTSAAPVGLGTTGVHRAAVMGDFPWKISEWKEQRVAGWDFTGGLLEGTHGGYRIEPQDGGSHVLIFVTLHLNGFAGTLIPLLKLIVPRRLASDLRKLKALMET